MKNYKNAFSLEGGREKKVRREIHKGEGRLGGLPPSMPFSEGRYGCRALKKGGFLGM